MPKRKQNRKKSNSKVRRAARRNAQSRAIVAYRPQAVSPALARWMNMVLNPFGNGTPGPKYISAARPDGSVKSVMLVVAINHRIWSGGTATSGHVYLAPPSSEAAWYMCSIFYGNDAFAAAASPTTTSYTAGSPEEYSMLNAILNTRGCMARVEAAAVKVRGYSAPDVTAGYLQGTHDRVCPAYADASYHTYSYCLDGSIEERRTVPSDGKESGGISVRMPITAASSQWHPVEATSAYLADVNRLLWGPMPGVTFSIGASTTIMADSVMHIAVQVPERVVPSVLDDIGADPMMDQAIAFVNSKEFVVSGNSFKSFFQGLGRGIVRAANFVVKAAPLVSQLASLAL